MQQQPMQCQYLHSCCIIACRMMVSYFIEAHCQASAPICILQGAGLSSVQAYVDFGGSLPFPQVCLYPRTLLDCRTLLQEKPSSHKTQGRDTANLLVYLLLQNPTRGTRGTLRDTKSTWGFSWSTILTLVAQLHSAYTEHKIASATLWNMCPWVLTCCCCNPVPKLCLQVQRLSIPILCLMVQLPLFAIMILILIIYVCIYTYYWYYYYYYIYIYFCCCCCCCYCSYFHYTYKYYWYSSCVYIL